MTTGKRYTQKDAALLEDIISNRRDVRGNHFLPKPIENKILDKLIDAAVNAPSVGFSQPWEFVVINSNAIKTKIKQSFDEENTRATDIFTGEKKEKYIRLKLEGITEAPVNIAVFYKPASEPVLGQTTMEEAGLFSVVCAVQNMWLMARALNIGMGWVSILDPVKVKHILRAPSVNRLVAYLCIGYVDKFLIKPELESLQWESRKKKETVVLYNNYEW